MARTRLLALLLCQDVSIDEGRYTLTNTFDLSFTPGLPVVMPTKIFSKIEGDLPAVYELVFSRVDPRMELARATATIEPKGPSVTHHHVFPLTVNADSYGD